MSDTEQQRLIRTLLTPSWYPHRVEEVTHLETHISHVLLAGDKAYKIKKPLDLGFLNFSTLDRRRFYCEEELRLNRRLAPELYEAVVAFSGTPEAPQFDGEGEAFEYAVRMKRFDREQELDRLLERDALPRHWMDELAQTVGDFHRSIPRAGKDSSLGTPEAVLAPMEENFDQLEALLEDSEELQRLARLREWTLARFRDLRERLATRHREGFIRECHGDMHLGNMAQVDDRIVIFDGIEFSESLRWIDVASEVAFVTMDLKDRGAPAHAHRFLNGWLEHTGDYAMLTLLPFYEVYRAMVRAKVAGIRLGQEGLATEEREQARAQCQEYLAFAEQLTEDATKPALLINHGLSGSGKTTLSQPLVEELGAVTIRSDVERKRLAGMDALERGSTDPGAGIYAEEMSRRTYTRLAELCEEVLKAGYVAIADATFLGREYRDIFARLARRLGVPFVVLHFQAPEAVLRERVEARAARGDDASDAGVAVLEHQLRTVETPGDDESVIRIDSTAPLSPDKLHEVRQLVEQDGNPSPEQKEQ